MILIPYSFNGTSLQSTDYTSNFSAAQTNLQVATNPSYVKRAGAYPLYSGKEIQPHTLLLDVLCDKTNFMEAFENLNKLFDTQDETPYQLICTDNGDTDSQWYVYATPKQVQGGHEGPMATVTLSLDDPVWQNVTQNTLTWTTTDSTSSTDITINSNADAYPIIEITPTEGPSTDYLYNRYVQVLPTSTVPWANRFLDISGSWDTASTDVIGGGKMTTDGNDLRVFRDGVEVSRWLDGINTTDTHVIVSCDMPAAYNMTLGTAIASTGTPAEVILSFTTANQTTINKLPTKGRLIIDSSIGSTDSEEFTYTAKVSNATAKKLAFTVNARAVRGTTALAHAAGTNVRYLPYDFNIVYGNAGAEAPETDDTKKPIQSLTSRNNSFIYTNFFDTAGTRPNTWKKQTFTVSSPALTRSEFYTSTSDEGDTDPATAIGVTSKTYQALGAWKADAVNICWLGYFPDVISSISANGAQSQSSSDNPAYMRMISSPDYSKWGVVFNLSAQTSSDYGTFTAWSKPSTDCAVSGSPKYLLWQMYGSQLGSTDVYTKIELSSITVGLTNVPNVVMRDEINHYKLDCTITNETTGDALRVTYPMAVNETVYIDTDPNFPNAKHNGQIVGAVTLSSTRAEWLKLQPGSNTISYQTELGGASGISIVLKWRERLNFF